MKLIFGIILTCTLHQLFAFELINTRDQVNSDLIRTVQFYPNTQEQNCEINYPVLPLYSETPLVLEFDELGEQMSDYSVLIFNCTWDWKKSNVSDLDYLDDYNDFPITDIERSAATKISFTHYRFNVPKVNIPGNYVVVVYNDNNPEKAVIVKRFSVYSSVFRIQRNNLSTFISATASKQMLNFDIQLTREAINSALGEVKVLVRQNGRWDKFLGNLSPSFMDMSDAVWSYQFIDESEIFNGGNEFRVFDSRSSIQGGRGLDRQNFTSPDTSKITLIQQDDRSVNVYSRQEDINGQFVIDNYEFGDGDIESDYVKTTFSLKTYPRNSEVYVFGAFTNWSLLPNFKMHYNETMKRYEVSPMVKQGYYNYIFVEKNNGVIDETAFEGSFTQTENVYEIFTYYKKPGQLVDKLVGYRIFRLNKY